MTEKPDKKNKQGGLYCAMLVNYAFMKAASDTLNRSSSLSVNMSIATFGISQLQTQ